MQAITCEKECALVLCCLCFFFSPATCLYRLDVIFISFVIGTSRFGFSFTHLLVRIFIVLYSLLHLSSQLDFLLCIVRIYDIRREENIIADSNLNGLSMIQ